MVNDCVRPFLIETLVHKEIDFLNVSAFFFVPLVELWEIDFDRLNRAPNLHVFAQVGLVDSSDLFELPILANAFAHHQAEHHDSDKDQRVANVFLEIELPRVECDVRHRHEHDEGNAHHDGEALHGFLKVETLFEIVLRHISTLLSTHQRMKAPIP